MPEKRKRESESNNQLKKLKRNLGDPNKMRQVLRGNEQDCLKLMKQAIENDDPVAQIQLSFVLFGMRWGKDAEHFNTRHKKHTVNILTTHEYYPREFALFHSAYDEAMKTETKWREAEAMGESVFGRAAEQEFLPAVLTMALKEWNHHTESYGLAVRLQPHVGKGDCMIDYHFGSALRNGCAIGSDLFYQGLNWMESSGKNIVLFPRKDQTFKDFRGCHIHTSSCTFFDFRGLLFLGYGKILAPSVEYWEKFKKDKFKSLSAYIPMLAFDEELIGRLIKQHKVTFIGGSTWSELDRARVSCLSVYMERKEIGEIHVTENEPFEIRKSFSHHVVQPVIDFLSAIMKTCGSTHSAHAWATKIDWKA